MHRVQRMRRDNGLALSDRIRLAVGAALANRKYGRLTINFNGDGDLNYAPGVLWTAVHHQIPPLPSA